MPFNECYLPLIRMAFPQAPIIHLVRHPLDVVVSMFANKLNHGFYCAYSPEGIVHHLLAVHEHYRRQMTSGEIVVQYERLVGDPEAQTRRLLQAAGLSFEDACLTPQKQNVYSATPSYAAVGDAINTRAVNPSSTTPTNSKSTWSRRNSCWTPTPIAQTSGVDSARQSRNPGNPNGNHAIVRFCGFWMLRLRAA